MGLARPLSSPPHLSLKRAADTLPRVTMVPPPLVCFITTTNVEVMTPHTHTGGNSPRDRPKLNLLRRLRCSPYQVVSLHCKTTRGISDQSYEELYNTDSCIPLLRGLRMTSLCLVFLCVCLSLAHQKPPKTVAPNSSGGSSLLAQVTAGNVN